MLSARSLSTIGAALLLVAADSPKPEWTSDLSKMKAPDAPVSGKIQGLDFTMEAVKYEPSSSTLSFRQGKNLFPDAEITVFLFLKEDESPEGKIFEMAIDVPISAHQPHVHIERSFPNKKLPTVLAYSSKYAMKLQLGAKKDGKVPGTIYVCLPDDDKSFVAGTFSVEVK